LSDQYHSDKGLLGTICQLGTTLFKGTVSVSLSDPPCKDDNTQFTTTTLKTYSDKNVEDIFAFF